MRQTIGAIGGSSSYAHVLEDTSRRLKGLVSMERQRRLESFRDDIGRVYNDCVPMLPDISGLGELRELHEDVRGAEGSANIC